MTFIIHKDIIRKTVWKGEIIEMKKRCTQSSCRKVFNPKRCFNRSFSSDGSDEFYVSCPYCGKKYRNFEIFSSEVIQSIQSTSKDLKIYYPSLFDLIWQIYEVTRNAEFGFMDILSLLKDKDFKDIYKNSSDHYLARKICKKTGLSLNKSIQVVSVLKYYVF